MSRWRRFVLAVGSLVALGLLSGAPSSRSRGRASLSSAGSAAKTPPPPLAQWDDTTLVEHPDDVADYTLRATLDPTHHTLHGEGTITFRNASRIAVHELWLHLYLNAFKNQRSTFLREPVGGFRGSEPLKDWGTIDIRSLSLRNGDAADDLLPQMERTRPEDGPGGDETDARVPLPREVRPGETITLDVVWDDKLPTIVERTGYDGSFHFVGQWFPKLARLEPDGRWAHFPFHHLAEFYADFGTYDVTLDVPQAFLIGATGPTVERRFEGGRRIERHLQTDIHDFAFTAWDEFEAREETIDGVKVKMLSPPGYDVDVDHELASLRFALPFFRERYGPYPYPVLTVVHPPESATEAGGMEYPTLITTGGAWYQGALSRLPELVTVHEFGHQYFYGLIATNEVEWPFLDEGVNSYAEADVLHAMFGAGSALSLAGLTVSDDAIQATFASQGEHAEPVAQPAYAFTTGDRYGGLVYQRTGAILETLRRVYGEEPFQRALGNYTRRYRFEHPGPDDFIRTFEETMGNDVAVTLRRALFEKGWVDYAVTEVESHATVSPKGIFDRDGKRETVGDASTTGVGQTGWVMVERRGDLQLPVDIELVLEDGSRPVTHWDGASDRLRIPYEGKASLIGAIVDPEHRVALDDNLTNNHATANGRRGKGANGVWERALYYVELFVAGVTP